MKKTLTPNLSHRNAIGMGEGMFRSAEPTCGSLSYPRPLAEEGRVRSGVRRSTQFSKERTQVTKIFVGCAPRIGQSGIVSRKVCPGPPLDSGFRRNDGIRGRKGAKERQ